MTSYLQRYLDGDHNGVWDELRMFLTVPTELVADVEAVAAETMQRVSRHVARIAEAIGVFYEPPTDAERATLDKLRGEIVGVPIALDACMRYVGDVWFAGDRPELDVYYNEPGRWGGMPPGPGYPDPLVLPPVDHLAAEWAHRQDYLWNNGEHASEYFVFQFAPDELHKANVSGSTHDIVMPDFCADPPIEGVAGRPYVFLVDYLRASIAWGGFPGWEFAKEHTPAAVTALRVEPDF